MRKFSLISLAMLIVSLPTIAGGLLTNTNQNAAFLRNPARGAVIAIDGVYSNPAGIAFLPEGFHLSLSWQAAWQKRQITTNLGTEKLFEGSTAAPVIPSFQAAYVFNDKWSLSAQFAIGAFYKRWENCRYAFKRKLCRILLCYKTQRKNDC